MVDTNFIIFLVMGVTLAVGVGMGIGMFANWFKGRMLGKRASDFLAGNRDNICELDGERVHINKFILKNREGKMENVEIPRIRKITQPVASFKENEGVQGKHEVSNY